jgi:cell volume regulation protein A
MIIGNARYLGRIMKLEEKRFLSEDVGSFHDQLAFVVKVFFFTFIGLMLEPNIMGIMLGMIITALCLFSRYPAAFIALKGAKDYSPFDKKIIITCMPRGLAAGVLATLPAHRGVEGTENLASIVFSVIIFSVLLFAVRFAILKRNQPDDVDENSVTVDMPLG